MLSRRRFLIASPLLALAGCSRRSSEESLWIGHIGPLSGPGHASGEAAQHGMALAIEDVNGEGELGAGRRLAILHADSRGSPERARSEAVRLITLNTKLTALVGGRDQASADRLAQALQPYPAVLLTSASCSTPSLDGVYSLDVAPAFRGECLARFASGHLKARRAVLLTDDTSPFCAAVASAFAGQWRSAAGQSLLNLDAGAEGSTARVTAQLSKTDVVVIAASADAAVPYRKFLGGKETDLPLVFAGEPAEWQRLEAGPGVYAVVVHAARKFGDAGKAFLAKHKERFHEDADADACRGYECIRVLAAALRESKGTGGLRLREVLREGKDFPALTGPIRFKDGRAIRPLFAVQSLGGDVLQSFDAN